LKTDEERTDRERGRPTSILSDDDAHSTTVLSDSPGDQRHSVSPGDFDKSRLEKYRDEVERIRDAMADSSWYADDDEPATEDDDETPIGAQYDYVFFAVLPRFATMSILVVRLEHSICCVCVCSPVSLWTITFEQNDL